MQVFLVSFLGYFVWVVWFGLVWSGLFVFLLPFVVVVLGSVMLVAFGSTGSFTCGFAIEHACSQGFVCSSSGCI